MSAAPNNTPAKQSPPTAAQTARPFFEKLSSELSKRADDYKKLLPAYLTPQRFYSIAYQSVARTPKLQECTISSILNCVMQAADLGLEIGGTRGQAYMVPFKNKHTGKREAQFIPGYKGLVHLAYLTGEVTKITARVVRERDFFEIQYGVDEHIIHKPAKGDRGEPVGCYSIAWFTNGQVSFDYMEADEIKAIQDRSKSGDDGPWVTDPLEMGKKTVIKRHSKVWPTGSSAAAMKLSQAIELDNTATGYDLETEGSPVAGDEKTPTQMDDDEKVVETGDPTAFLTEEQRTAVSKAAAKSKISDADFSKILNKYSATDTGDLQQQHMSAVLMELISL